MKDHLNTACGGYNDHGRARFATMMMAYSTCFDLLAAASQPCRGQSGAAKPMTSREDKGWERATTSITHPICLWSGQGAAETQTHTPAATYRGWWMCPLFHSVAWRRVTLVVGDYTTVQFTNLHARLRPGLWPQFLPSSWRCSRTRTMAHLGRAYSNFTTGLHKQQQPWGRPWQQRPEPRQDDVIANAHVACYILEDKAQYASTC